MEKAFLNRFQSESDKKFLRLIARIKPIAEKLAAKYSKEELAQLLIKNKGRRISNLIASAYNKKVMNQQIKNQKFDFYDFNLRTVGPDSWIYTYITKDPWEEFEAKLNKAENEDHRAFIISSEYYSWQQNLIKQKYINIQKAVAMDNKVERIDEN